jgi:hypothetical protein
VTLDSLHSVLPRNENNLKIDASKVKLFVYTPWRRSGEEEI